MATYSYVAINRQGKEVKGQLEAENETQVQNLIKAKDLALLEVNKQSVLTKDIELDIGNKVTSRDLSVFCRQFVSMTRAGVTILEALSLLGEQTENPRLQKAIIGVQSDVEKGGSMSEAMAKYPKVFSDLMVNTIGAGEASGKLDVAFDRMALQFEKSAKTQALVKKAMIYPIIVLSVSLIVMILMLVLVIPKYTDMFGDLGVDLPGITVAVINLSDFVINNWLILVVLIIAIVVALKLFAKSTAGKMFFGNVTRKMPIFGKLTVKNASSLFARTLSTLISSGVPLEEAIEITARCMTNIHYKNALLEARNRVLQGINLSVPIEECGLFPPMVYHMIRIGEESGNTEDMLNKLADYYDEEVEMATQSVMAALEPMIIIMLAVVVGTLIAACIAPMVKMYGALDNL